MIIASLELYPTDPVRYIELAPDIFLRKGDYIIYTSEELQEEAGLVKRIDDMDAEKIPEEISTDLATGMSMLRVATDHDKQKIDAHERSIDNAMHECEQFITQHNLEMKLVTAHISYSNKQIMFVFTAESRVDFRGLVKDLARHFKRRVRLKQIGPRDRARYVGQKYGAYGRCGRPLCCATFLKDLDSVTMDMVRSQALANKGAAKLSGVCGKLMHCLAYEVEMYQSLKKELPDVGKKVKTEFGLGTVSSYDILSQMVTVLYEDATMKSLHLKDLVVL